MFAEIMTGLNPQSRSSALYTEWRKSHSTLGATCWECQVNFASLYVQTDKIKCQMLAGVSYIKDQTFHTYADIYYTGEHTN